MKYDRLIDEDIVVEQAPAQTIEYTDFTTVSAAIDAANAAGKVIYARVETKRPIGFIHFEVHPNGIIEAHAGEKTAKTMDGPVTPN